MNTIQRGQIYFIDMPPQQGNIQAGHRPVIVVQNNVGNCFSPTVIVCPITSKKKKELPTHLHIGASGGLYFDSTILCEQLQTIQKTELKYYVGIISDKNTLQELDKKIRISLGLEEHA